MTTPGVDVVQESPEARTEKERDTSVKVHASHPTRKGRFLGFVGGFAFLAATLFPMFVVQTRGTVTPDFTYWNTLGLAACVLGALGAFAITVFPGRFVPLLPLLAPLPVLPIAAAAMLGAGTSRAYQVGPGYGAFIAVAAAAVTLLAAARALPRLWRP